MVEGRKETATRLYSKKEGWMLGLAGLLEAYWLLLFEHAPIYRKLQKVVLSMGTVTGVLMSYFVAGLCHDCYGRLSVNENTHANSDN